MIAASVTGNPVYDAMGSICIGVVLLVISFFIATRVRTLLVGKSADPLIEREIREVIMDQPDIERVLNMITIQFGPDTMLATKVRLRKGISIEDGVAAINAMEVRLKQNIPELKWSFVEPDVSD